MKIVKIKKRYYKDLQFMYNDLGLVKNNECDPSRVLCSSKDLKLFQKATKEVFAKVYSWSTPKSLQSSVSMYLLNLGPSERAKQAIKPGYLIILDI